MLLDRLREVEWKTVSIIAIPLLVVSLTVGLLLVRGDGVSGDALRRAQYGESVRNVNVLEVSPYQEIGEYARVPSDITVEEAEDPYDAVIDYDDEESTNTVTAGEKLGEDDPDTIIDPEVDGEPVPEGEEAVDGEVPSDDPEPSVSDNSQSLVEPLTQEYLVTDESGLYTVNFYPADKFLASGRFASEEDADFSIDALEELTSEVDMKQITQIGFIEGLNHTGAYMSYAQPAENEAGEEVEPNNFFRAYVTNGDTVAVIEGSITGGFNGYRPDFLPNFNLTTP